MIIQRSAASLKIAVFEEREARKGGGKEMRKKGKTEEKRRNLTLLFYFSALDVFVLGGSACKETKKSKP